MLRLRILTKLRLRGSSRTRLFLFAISNQLCLFFGLGSSPQWKRYQCKGQIARWFTIPEDIRVQVKTKSTTIYLDFLNRASWLCLLLFSPSVVSIFHFTAFWLLLLSTFAIFWLFIYFCISFCFMNIQQLTMGKISAMANTINQIPIRKIVVFVNTCCLAHFFMFLIAIAKKLNDFKRAQLSSI